MSAMQNRYRYIDLARGIAILSVVLGHAYSPNGGQVVIPLVYSFHMPFFFLISGALLGSKAAYGKKLSFHLKSKAKSLLLPYVFWGLMCQTVYFVLGMIGGDSLSEQLQLRLHEITTLTNGAMWFLLTMFLAQLLFLFMIRKPYIHIPYCIALMVGAVFIPSLPTILGTDILRAFVGCFFMAIGFYGYTLFFKKVPLPILLLLSVVNVVLIFRNNTVSIASLAFGNPFLYIINGCLGSWLLVQYCMHLAELPKAQAILKLVTVWGKYSIVILCLHLLAIECVRLADHILFHSILPKLSHAEGPVLTVIVMLLLSLSMPLLLRFFSWSWGLKKPSEPLFHS